MVIVGVAALCVLLALAQPVLAKPWRFLSATQHGERVTVVLEDAGDPSQTKRTETLIYYLGARTLTTTIANDIKSALRAKIQDRDSSDTVRDLTTVLDPGP